MQIIAANGRLAHEMTGCKLWKLSKEINKIEIRQAYREHGVLKFRRQALSEPYLLAFGNFIGLPPLYEEAHWLSKTPKGLILSN